MQSSKAMTTQRYLLIVDEAQESYVKQDFWIDYLKTVSDTPSQDLPYVFLLSSWGNPSEIPVVYVNSPPTTFEPAKRMSIQPTKSFPVGLYFTQDDFNDLIWQCFDNFESKNNGKIKECLTKQARAFVFEYTSGHPGLCKAIGNLISNESTVSFYTLIDYLD